MCDGRISLATAQRRIVNWNKFVTTTGGGSPTSSPPPTGNCDRAYPTVCIPPLPPDLDCSEIPHRNFKVLPPDPDHFDGDGNGIGYEAE